MTLLDPGKLVWRRDGQLWLHHPAVDLPGEAATRFPEALIDDPTACLRLLQKITRLSWISTAHIEAVLRLRRARRTA